jgi:PiT family inorganic phosphate transporter
MGVGSARRIKAVKWKIARDIVLTWVVTLPACIVLGAFCTIIIEGVMAI